MIARDVMRLFFYLLYHPFAWAYDLVATLVSFGHWQDWVRTAVDLMPPGPVLELGFGPGHLLAELRRKGMPVTGIDASRQMVRLARSNLRRAQPAAPLDLARAQGQALPFHSEYFSAVVATFPTEYIARPETLSEVLRVLRPDGRFIILLAAQITGHSLPARALRALYRLTGEPPTPDQIQAYLRIPSSQSGFIVVPQWIEQPGGRLLFLIGERMEKNNLEEDT